MLPLPNNQTSLEAGFAHDLFLRYTERLLKLARQRLPEPVRQRLDPEDVVQSVYRSFFLRLREGRFSFNDSGDLWRLLAAMTYQKACEAGRFHKRFRRDARRDRPLDGADSPRKPIEPTAVEPGPDDLATLVECMDRLMQKLPAKYRDIALHNLEGHTVEQIAVKVNRTTRTVFRALADMEKMAVQLMQ